MWRRWVLVIVIVSACAPGFGGSARWFVAQPSAAWVSPDGSSAVLVGNTDTALVDAHSGKRTATVPIHTYVPVAFSPDGTWFAIVDPERHCTALWRVAPAHEEACVASGGEARVAFSPDGDAIAIADDAQIVRWSVAFRSQVWRSAGRGAPAFVAWPSPGTIVVGTDDMIGVNAADGRIRWSQPQSAGKFLGTYRGDGVVQLFDAIARIDLDTGVLRDQTEVAGTPSVLLDDGTVIVANSGELHRYRIGGAELGRTLGPVYPNGISASRDGEFAVVVGVERIELWNLRDGAPFAPDGAQLGPIVALDADDRAVVSAAADGSVIVRDPGGRAIEQRHTKAGVCRTWAVDAPSRQAVCGAVLATSGLAHSDEWLDLDTGRSRIVDWFSTDAVAVGHGVAWLFGYGAVWADATHVPDRSTPRLESRASPRVARIANGGNVVVYGGTRFEALPDDARSPGTWVGFGLYAMDRSGHEVALDPALGVERVATDRAGERLAVSTGDRVELWIHRGGPLAWSRQWSVARDTGIWLGARAFLPVGIAIDGSRVAVVIPNAIVVLDAATGRELGRIPDTHEITALALHGDTVYVGTERGLVIAHPLFHM